jgi:hypothetical protein
MKLLEKTAANVVIEMTQSEFDAIYQATFTLESSFHMLGDNPCDLTEDLVGHCGDQLEDILEDANEALAEARRVS